MLGNLYDYQPDAAEERIPWAEMDSLDKWILERLAQVGEKSRQAYENYEYHVIFHSLFNFFTIDLSAFYLDVSKDRLYCSAPKDRQRKSGQTALFHLLRDTLLLMAPLLPFTTEEAWQAMPAYRGKSESIHLELFPEFKSYRLPAEEVADWEKLLATREQVLKALERAREEKFIGNSLEAKVRLKVLSADASFYKRYEDKLAELFITSGVEILVEEEEGGGKKEREREGELVAVEVLKAEGSKCQRCWNIKPSVGQANDYPDFCERCVEVVRRLKRD